MGWKGLERNKLDFILTDLLPVEVSELFSFSTYYDFLLKKQSQQKINMMTDAINKCKAKSDRIMFQEGWSTKPLKYQICKGTGTYREMSIINPVSAINVFLFIECYQKEILDYFERRHCYSIRYQKKNSDLYYKTAKGTTVEYFQLQSQAVNRGVIEQIGNYFKIAPFESLNAFMESRMWRLCNFKYKYYAKMDYKSCFDSIYTHAYSWIIERNTIDAKNARNSHLFLTIDRLLQNINGRSSNGVVVGPEFSRMIAEIMLQQIDDEVRLSLLRAGMHYKEDYIIFRYVDDIYVFANEKSVLDKIILEFKNHGEKYRLRLNDMKMHSGETPWLPKTWIEKTRDVADMISDMFSKIKKTEYDKLPEEEKHIVKTANVSVDRLKDEISVIIKNNAEDMRSVVSYLLSTLLNNISKKKNGYRLFADGSNKRGRAFMLIDLAFFIYAFYPSFEQTRKMISIITYIDKELDFKNNTETNKKLKSVFDRYSFVFKNGNLPDLCDWFPFFAEYGIELGIEVENVWHDRISELNNPVLWANLLLYSKYNVNYHSDLTAEIESIIGEQVDKMVYEDPMMNSEFWYIIIFHNCPYISQTARDNMSGAIDKIRTRILGSALPHLPSNESMLLLCDFLEQKSISGKKPDNSFFNWKKSRDFGSIITYKTFHRTIFKKYKKNTYGLYASIS